MYHSVVSNSVTLWTAARQVPLSVEFSRQEYWSRLPCSPPGDHLNSGIDPRLLHCRQILYHLSHQFSSVQFSRSVVSDLCDPIDCSPPGFSVHGILQARILEWDAIPFSTATSSSSLQTLTVYCEGTNV